MPKRTANLPYFDINQGELIPKVEAYLRGRGRRNMLYNSTERDVKSKIDIGGVCNGVCGLLLERVFYDCINRHYRTQKPINELLQIALGNFFNEISGIINTNDELLDSKQIQQKMDRQRNPEYQAAKDKLSAAIDSGELKIPVELKSKYQHYFKRIYVSDESEAVSAPDDTNETMDYFVNLVALAHESKILTDAEALYLLTNHIPDIPRFEKLINKVFLLQTGNSNLIFRQAALKDKFQQLDITEDKTKLPQVVEEYDQALVFTPEELLANLEKLLPEQRMVRISLPNHTVAAFRIGGDFYYFEPNAPEAGFIYCASAIIFVLKIAITELGLARKHANDLRGRKLSDEESTIASTEFIKLLGTVASYSDEQMQEHKDDDRNWLLEHPQVITNQIDQLKIVLKILEDPASAFSEMVTTENADNNNNNDDDDNLAAEILDSIVAKATLIALQFMPPVFAMAWQVFSHPQSAAVNYPTFDDLYHATQLTDLVKRRDFAGRTILAYLNELDKVDHIKILLQQIKSLPISEQKEFLDRPDRVKGFTALHFACSDNDVELARLLLEAGANPNVETNALMSPLQIAIVNNNIELIKLLLLHHADMNISNKNGNDTLALCISHNVPSPTQIAIFDLLLPHAKFDNPQRTSMLLHLCMSNKNYDCLNRLLAMRNKPNVRINLELPFANDFTPLKFAVFTEDIRAIGMLRLNGAKMNKDYLQEIEMKVANKSIKNPHVLLVLKYPFILNVETKAQQIQLMFKSFYEQNPGLSLFGTTWHQYKQYANKISDELSKPVNQNLNDSEIRQLIIKELVTIPGGHEKLRHGEFKKMVDLILNHFLTKPVLNENVARMEVVSPRSRRPLD